MTTREKYVMAWMAGGIVIAGLVIAALIVALT
jgi:hypothetical protein